MLSTKQDWRKNPEHLQLQQLIDAGWGNVPQQKIPANWQTKKPPTYYANDALLEDHEAKAARMKRSQLAKRKHALVEQMRRARIQRWA